MPLTLNHDGTISSLPNHEDLVVNDGGTLPPAAVPYLGRRNLIINGGFDIWQRGTSHSTTGQQYGADRWLFRDATVSRSTDVPTNQGFKYSLFLDNDISEARTTINLRQVVENGKVMLNNRPFTVSFWLKSSVATTISVDDDAQNKLINVTTDWEYYSVTFSAHVTNPNNVYGSDQMYIDFNLGDDFPDIYVTGVQLEVGEVATPFEHRSYGEELALCQRYYWRTRKDTESASDAFIGLGGLGASGYRYISLEGRPLMRTTPTIGLSGSIGQFSCVRWGLAWDTASNWSVHMNSSQTTNLSISTGISSTEGHSTAMKADGSSFFYADAEL